MKLAGEACGKVILFGEHAVVYGVPALAVGIDRGARAVATRLEPGNPSTLTIRSTAARFAPDSDWCTRVGDAYQDTTPLHLAFRALIEATCRANGNVDPVSVEAFADVPPGGGLGCSAALGVAIGRALDPSASTAAIAERAGAWEHVFHGNASGVDAAVASMGGCVLFERAQAGARATLTSIRVPGTLHLCIGNSGQSSSTRVMVEAVARLRERRADSVRQTFDAIHALVNNARLAIEALDRTALGQLMDLNQMLLAGLFVSTSEIEQLCRAAREHGALGAKLTGAGGGGCVVALVATPESGARVLEAWKREGFDGFLTSVGAPAERIRNPLVSESPA